MIFSCNLKIGGAVPGVPGAVAVEAQATHVEIDDHQNESGRKNFLFVGFGVTISISIPRCRDFAELKTKPA